MSNLPVAVLPKVSTAPMIKPFGTSDYRIGLAAHIIYFRVPSEHFQFSFQYCTGIVRRLIAK